jgi:FkbM family methyltransferase
VTELGAMRRPRLWHPQQRLWNRDLIDGVERLLAAAPRLRSGLVNLIVAIDTILLWVRVLWRRATHVALCTAREHPVDADASILFIDCGVHCEGQEIQLVTQWFAKGHDLHVLAFEAGTWQFGCASETLADIPNLDLRHAAVVGPAHESDTARMYRTHLGDVGEGDSIRAQRGPFHEVVPAVRLSDVLRSNYSRHRGPIVLRMNIEGAEWDVVQDLRETGLLPRISGFYGLWDDLSFIDPAADAEFRKLVNELKIRPTTFNGRDLEHPLRCWAIRYDLKTTFRTRRRWPSC